MINNTRLGGHTFESSKHRYIKKQPQRHLTLTISFHEGRPAVAALAFAAALDLGAGAAFFVMVVFLVVEVFLLVFPGEAGAGAASAVGVVSLISGAGEAAVVSAIRYNRQKR